MENYIVSARKYRPAEFESVVGQGAITQTLRNAIRSNHLAQAYLFCGPRGVGKTTCARIFAKTINCLNPTATHDACNECESCRSFNEQRSLNIHELDAASNNSVDNIRMLIEQVRIPPQMGKYSVFIIDEVHMLSKDAFNALLKTLEEPPKYAIFILATTEKHKVIPTILSRCQVFDFARITVADIIHYLQYVAQKEGVEITEEALNVVAQKADGGMRDALSIFDQLVSFCGTNITYEQTIEVLNVLDTDYYFRVVDCALQSDVSQSLLLFNSILNKGFDAQNFIIGLCKHFRDLLVSKDEITVRLIEASDAVRQHYAEQAKKCSARFLIKALDLANTCDVQYKYAKNKRLTVELMLIKLCQLLVPEEPVQPQQLSSLKPTVQPQPAKQPAAQPTAQPTTQPTTQPTVQPAAQAVQPKAAPAASVQSVVTNVVVPPNIKTEGQRPVRVNIRTQLTAQTPQPTSADIPHPTEPEIKKRQNGFNDNDLQQVWLTLPRIFHKEERLKATLINSIPSVENNTNIVITLRNSLQEQEVLRVKQQILKELSDRLQNDDITLTTRVEEQKATAVYSMSEQYKNLVARNKEVEILKNELNMQFA